MERVVMGNFEKAKKKAKQAAQYDFEVHGKARPFASGAVDRSAWVKWYFEEYGNLESNVEPSNKTVRAME